MELEEKKGIYLGDRGMKFKNLIIGLLKQGNIKDKYIEAITDAESMKQYASAFTSDQVDENNNYQVYEQLGDVSINKFIVNYAYKRFPNLNCAEGVKVVARLRINLASKDSFCNIAEREGFWEFITATNNLRQHKKKSLLEDVFEAFIGATEFILDMKTKTGVGYACVYKILASIFDKMQYISLRYEDLYDAKTRLKEVFDLHNEKIGILKYENAEGNGQNNTSVYRVFNGGKILIGRGTACLKADAEQNASADALKTLEKQGIVKHAPSIYAKLSGKIQEKETGKTDVLKIVGTADKINDQFFTKGKSKYQNRYTSTALIHFCRKRDVKGVEICIDMGADPNIPDSEGLTASDTLLVGTPDDKVRDILEILKTNTSRLSVHKNIFDFYLDQKNSSCFDFLKE